MCDSSLNAGFAKSEKQDFLSWGIKGGGGLCEQTELRLCLVKISSLCCSERPGLAQSES